MSTPAAGAAGHEGRLPSLDGLRALAIAMVLAGHLEGTRGFDLQVRHWLGDYAKAGVQVFFVISGFLITTLLLNERQRTGKVSLKLFYLRRALRIVPAMLAYLLAMTMASHYGWIHLTRMDLLTAYTWTSNYYLDRSWEVGHLWSLSVEEQFYLLWPLAVAIVASRKRLVALCVAALAIAPVVRTALRILYPEDPLRDLEIFPAVADAIAAGCLLALLRERLLSSPVYLGLTSGPWHWLALPMIMAVNRFNGYTLVDLLGSTPALLGIAVMVEASTRAAARPVGRLLNSRPFVALGVLSYSLYLWQQPFLNRHSAAMVNAFPQNMLLALLAATASYLLLEKPLLRWRRRLAAGTAAG